MVVGVTDETTQISTGSDVYKFFAPREFTLLTSRASLSTPGNSSTTVNVKVGTNSIYSFGNSLTLASGNIIDTQNSFTSDPYIMPEGTGPNNQITIDIISAGTGAKGLKIYLIGKI